MSWRHLLRRLLALHCNEASALASRERDGPLGPADRLAFWGHLLACRSCRRFRLHLRRIAEASRRTGPHLIDADSPDGGLSPEARLRIEQALRRAGEDDRPGEGT